MRKHQGLSLLAATAMTIGGLFLPFSSATAKERTVVVTAPTEAPNLVVRRVSYADLDLAHSEGRSALNDRVGFAIGDICEEANLFDNGSPAFKVGVIRCSSSAWSNARPQIARAVQRADEIATTGSSSIAAAAITISLDR